MKNIKIASIILSAGFSSRMGDFKPFLKFGELTAVETIVNTYKNAGIDQVIVITGHNGNEVREKLKDLNVQCVLNESYTKGMFSSILKGIEVLDANISAFFIQPMDVPLVKRYTVEILKDRYLKGDKGIIYPNFCGKNGHPPLIDCKYKSAILASSGEGGLKRILENYTKDSLYVPVFDEAVLMDMDTKKDYEKLLKYRNLGAPSRKECESMMDIFKVPENIIKHCRKVAEVSIDILGSLGNYCSNINKEKLEAAALLHDIKKSEENHAQKGETLLKEIGYWDVGSIIGTHIDISVADNKKITENEILYLADKLLKEDKIITVDERLKDSMEAYGYNHEILNKIENRFDALNKIIDKIEKITGKGFIYG